MTFPTFLNYAVITTLLVAGAVAVDRGWAAIGPIKSLRAFGWQLVVVAIACSLVAWQLFFGGSKLLGQQPVAWVMLLMLFYVWSCMAANLRRGE